MGSAFAEEDRPPTEEGIRAVLESACDAWFEFDRCLADRGVRAEWRYYRDGGWLRKAVRGPKTVAWLSIEPSFFRVTCHFSESQRSLLAGSETLGQEIRCRLAETPPKGKLLSVSVDVHDTADIPTATSLLNTKLLLLRR